MASFSANAQTKKKESSKDSLENEYGDNWYRGKSKILIDTTFSSESFGDFQNFKEFQGMDEMLDMKKMMQLMMSQMQNMRQLDPKELEKLFQGFNFGDMMPLPEEKTLPNGEKVKKRKTTTL
jgi:hypothetical protein